MFPLPDPIILRLNNFAALFSPTVWGYALTLVIGALESRQTDCDRRAAFHWFIRREALYQLSSRVESGENGLGWR